MKNRTIILTTFLLTMVLFNISCSSSSVEKSSEQGRLQLNLRSREETPKGSGIWKEQITSKKILTNETAILICDMWTEHRCSGAERRIKEMAPVMNSVIEEARKNGVQIIHAPSGTMKYYENDPHRKKIKDVPRIKVPELPRLVKEPPLPFDPSVRGCDTNDDRPVDLNRLRQQPAIQIKGEDVISDSEEEIYSFLKYKGIKNLIIMGVHTNICILERPFGIKNMKRLGFNVILVRDLTDSMCNPEMPPHVSHEEGTRLVVEYIEKYWCPSISSSDLLEEYPLNK